MPRKKSVKKVNKNKKKSKVKLQEDSKLFAFLAVLLSIIGFVLALIVKKEDEYVRYYARQSFVIFITFLIFTAVSIVPIIGWVISPILSVFIFILWVIALVYSLSGEMKETPIIGQFGNKLNI